MRIGEGYDVHRLVPERRLILGGVEIPYEKGLLGHSDADALLHALMDAMLGALALGDTMGIMMIMAGLAVASGVNLLSLKLLLIVFLFWTASPVASHLIGRLELTTNEELDHEVKLWKR